MGDQVESLDHEQCNVYRYVAVVLNNDNLLVSCDALNHFSIPQFEGQHCSSSFANYYLHQLREHFGFAGNARVVLDKTFVEYELSSDAFVSLDVVEVDAEDAIGIGGLVSVPWRELFDGKETSRQHPAVFQALKEVMETGTLSEAKNVPWYRLRYYEKIVALFDKVLQSCGQKRTGEARQHQITEAAVVYRVPTSGGTVFLKVVHSDSAEVAQTCCMAKLFPNASPTLIEDAKTINAIASKDFGPTIHELYFSRNHCTTTKDEKDHISRLVLCQWAQIQQRSVGHITALTSVGVPVYDANWIRKGFDEVSRFWKADKRNHVDLAARMRPCFAYVEQIIALWAETRIPLTIVHGDLHENNIAQPERPGESFVFFDWDSIFIGYPFLDLHDAPSHPVFEQKNSYLECWTTYEDLQKIEEMAAWTRPLQYLIDAAFELRNTKLFPENRDTLVEMYSGDFCEAVEQLAQEKGKAEGGGGGNDTTII